MQEAEQRVFQKRQVAYKTRISDILGSAFVKDETSAGYIKLNETNVARVNIIANVVYKAGQEQNYSTIFVDDGTGKIMLRTFENTSMFSKVEVGDIVLIIGRIREFNNERYIIPEILKKVPGIQWMSLRKLELQSNVPVVEEVKSGNPSEDVSTPNTYEGIYMLIKKLDAGDGAPIEDVIKNSSNRDAEQMINKLLESGDVFEIKPGRLKVLE